MVDNAAVAFTLRNRLTSSVAGMEMLNNFSQELGALDVCLVISQDNPADCASRGKAIASDFEDRCSRLDRCIGAHELGWQWTSGKASDWIGEWTAMRHGPPTDENSPEVFSV